MVLSLVDTRHDQVGDIGTSSGTRSQHCTRVDHQIIGCGLMLTVSDKIRWFRRNKLLPHFPHSATLPELGRHHWHHEQEDAATNNGTWTPAAVQAAAWGQRPHTRLSRATAQGFARRGHCCHSHSWGRGCDSSSHDRVACSDRGRLVFALHSLDCLLWYSVLAQMGCQKMPPPTHGQNTCPCHPRNSTQTRSGQLLAQ